MNYGKVIVVSIRLGISMETNNIFTVFYNRFRTDTSAESSAAEPNSDPGTEPNLERTFVDTSPGPSQPGTPAISPALLQAENYFLKNRAESLERELTVARTQFSIKQIQDDDSKVFICFAAVCKYNYRFLYDTGTVLSMNILR
jgi:hypothetical protein